VFIGNVVNDQYALYDLYFFEVFSKNLNLSEFCHQLAQ
jgi:hypothetical protein